MLEVKVIYVAKRGLIVKHYFNKIMCFRQDLILLKNPARSTCLVGSDIFLYPLFIIITFYPFSLMMKDVRPSIFWCIIGRDSRFGSPDIFLLLDPSTHWI